MLANETIDDYEHSALDAASIELLREKQKVFYFNAWENDFINDALSALVLKLIADDDESLNLASIKRAASMINLSAGIKNVSHDFIDYSANTSKEKLVKDIQSIVDRREAVNDFMDRIKSDKERMVFIIDELDRCKPSFAVDVLEVIKHYFVRDDITFLMATNLSELSHTVEKYYGYNFDGSSYLNKFFDYSMGLKTVDISSYARDALNWSPNSYVVHEVAHDAINYLGLQMREINSYHSALRMIDRFLSRDRNWREEQYPIQFIFVPLALALKLKSNKSFVQFSEGRGVDLLRDFLPHTGSGMHYAGRWVTDRDGLNEEHIKLKAIDAMVDQYMALFVPEGRRGVREDLQDFQDAISLIGSYTTIPEESER